MACPPMVAEVSSATVVGRAAVMCVIMSVALSHCGGKSCCYVCYHECGAGGKSCCYVCYHECGAGG